MLDIHVSYACTLYTIYCTVYSVQYKVNTVYLVQCTIYIIQCIVYTVYCVASHIDTRIYVVSNHPFGWVDDRGIEINIDGWKDGGIE